MMIQNDNWLPYATDDATGILISISDITPERRGLKCRCHCAKCNGPLVAKLGYGGKKPHFAHQKDSDCHGANITYLHLLSEEILMEEKTVMVPKYKTIPDRKLFFTQVEVEQRNDRPDIQPDVVGITEDKKRFHIEIKNTSKVTDRKIKKIKESDIICLEIDVSVQPLDKEKLRNFLLESAESRKWINNPVYDKQIREEHYGDQTIQIEKYNHYKTGNKYEIIEKERCGFKCGVNVYNGKCVYQKDELYVNNVEYVVCDKKRREKDIKESPKATVPPIIANIKENSECHYLKFDYNQQSIDEICELLNERGEITSDDGLDGSIIVCERKHRCKYIVCLCHCNDRVYPLQVIVIWVENNQLRYEIKSCNQGKDKELAERNYKKIRDGNNKLVVPRYKKKDRKKDQDSIFVERNDCPF